MEDLVALLPLRIPPTRRCSLLVALAGPGLLSVLGGRGLTDKAGTHPGFLAVQVPLAGLVELLEQTLEERLA